jgi:hypothetical protein
LRAYLPPSNPLLEANADACVAPAYANYSTHV